MNISRALAYVAALFQYNQYNSTDWVNNPKALGHATAALGDGAAALGHATAALKHHATEDNNAAAQQYLSITLATIKPGDSSRFKLRCYNTLPTIQPPLEQARQFARRESGTGILWLASHKLCEDQGGSNNAVTCPQDKAIKHATMCLYQAYNEGRINTMAIILAITQSGRYMRIFGNIGCEGAWKNVCKSHRNYCSEIESLASHMSDITDATENSLMFFRKIPSDTDRSTPSLQTNTRSASW